MRRQKLDQPEPGKKKTDLRRGRIRAEDPGSSATAVTCAEQESLFSEIGPGDTKANAAERKPGA
ncbi:MAG: hypothetical protein M3O82_06725 [Verrucomicrobiota bacterium]|nr:hypothetical protein [Verrucomicrobiota bacterium]